MIFDSHVHLMKFGPEPGSIDEEEFSLLLRRMIVCGVDRSLLLGPVATGGFDPSPDDITLCNQQTVAAVNRQPYRFSGLCYLNPSHAGSFIDREIDRCIGDGPLVGVKLWVAVNSRDRRIDRIMQHCRRLECPILIHAWYKTKGRVHEESDPSDIAHLARRHPDVKIIMAHLHGCGVRGLLDIVDLPNVVVDTSGSNPGAGVVEYALNVLGPSRIVYGSDYPVRDFATQLGKLDLPTLSTRDYAKITHQNLELLLHRRSPCMSI